MRLALLTAVAIACVVVSTRPATADSWKTVACSETKFSMPGGLDAKCQEGPGNTGGTEGQCLFEEYFLSGNNQHFAAQIYMSGTARCYVNRPKEDDDAIKQFFPWVRNNASKWSDTKTVGGATGAYFDGSGSKCFAYYRSGPPRFQGVTYNIYGYYCSPKGHALDENQLASFIREVGVSY